MLTPAFRASPPTIQPRSTPPASRPRRLPMLSLGAGGSSGPQGRLELDSSLQQPFYLVPSEGQRPRPVCQTILQNVVVMKLGNFALAAAAPRSRPDSRLSNSSRERLPPRIWSLLSSPRRMRLLCLIWYIPMRRLMMTFRNPSDQSRLATEAATLQFLLSQYNIPVPAKLPYALESADRHSYRPGSHRRRDNHSLG